MFIRFSSGKMRKNASIQHNGCLKFKWEKSVNTIYWRVGQFFGQKGHFDAGNEENRQKLNFCVQKYWISWIARPNNSFPFGWGVFVKGMFIVCDKNRKLQVAFYWNSGGGTTFFALTWINFELTVGYFSLTVSGANRAWFHFHPIYSIQFENGSNRVLFSPLQSN